MSKFTGLYLKLVLIVVCSSVFFMGCGGGGNDDGFVGAMAKDARTGNALSNVAIDFQNASGVSEKIAYTDAQGKIFEKAALGTYMFVFSKAGYISENYFDVKISASETNYLETTPLVPESAAGNGSLSGTIVNALDGLGVSGLVIEFRRGMNARTGSTSATATTGGGGAYTVSGIEAGVYTAVIPAQSIFGASRFLAVCFGNENNPNQDGVVSPILPPGQTRIVLTWGSVPADLDSHLYGPMASSSGEFHVWFNDDDYSDGGTRYAALDLDDINGNGPETSTVYEQVNGNYEFIVYDYTNGSVGNFNSSGLANSGAKVRIFRGSECIAIYDVPSDSGTMWTVFTMSGSTIRPVNTMSAGKPSGM